MTAPARISAQVKEQNFAISTHAQIAAHVTVEFLSKRPIRLFGHLWYSFLMFIIINFNVLFGLVYKS